MILKIRKNIDFMGMRKVTLSLSLVLVVVSLGLLGFKGLTWGSTSPGATWPRWSSPTP